MKVKAVEKRRFMPEDLDVELVEIVFIDEDAKDPTVELMAGVGATRRPSMRVMRAEDWDGKEDEVAAPIILRIVTDHEKAVEIQNGPSRELSVKKASVSMTKEQASTKVEAVRIAKELERQAAEVEAREAAEANSVED